MSEFVEKEIQDKIEKVKCSIPEYFREFVYMRKRVGYKQIDKNSMLMIKNISISPGYWDGYYAVEFYNLTDNKLETLKVTRTFGENVTIEQVVNLIRSTFGFWDKKGTKYKRNLGSRYEEIQAAKNKKLES